MESPDRRQKLVVLLTAGANGDRASIAFTIANASLSAGMEVMVFLASDGVDLTREGAADHSHHPPFLPLGELVAKFAAQGGRLVACGSCVQFRGLHAEGSTPTVQVLGVSALVEWLAAGATTVTL